MAEWARILNTTIAQYIRKEEVNVLRQRRLLALLQERGRITMSHSGDKMNWKVRFKENELQAYTDGGAVTFPRINRHKSAELEWRGYTIPESMTKKERLMNKDKEAIINIFTELTSWMMSDAKASFGSELFVDGNATGNEGRIHGLESFFGDDGSVNTSMPIADSSDSYAGLSTVLASEGGGTWTGNWPAGSGDSAYDFWTPLLVDYESAVANPPGWSAATKTWPNTCVEALRFAIIYTQKNRTMEDQLDLFMVTADMYRQLEDFVDAAERITVQRGGDKSAMVKLGFMNVLNIDGLDVTWEYDIPASTGYGLNVDKLELASLQGQMFVPEGPTYDEATKSWRFDIDFFGNFKGNPRNQAKLKDYT